MTWANFVICFGASIIMRLVVLKVRLYRGCWLQRHAFLPLSNPSGFKNITKGVSLFTRLIIRHQHANTSTRPCSCLQIRTHKPVLWPYLVSQCCLIIDLLRELLITGQSILCLCWFTLCDMRVSTNHLLTVLCIHLTFRLTGCTAVSPLECIVSKCLSMVGDGCPRLRFSYST